MRVRITFNPQYGDAVDLDHIGRWETTSGALTLFGDDDDGAYSDEQRVTYAPNVWISIAVIK